MDATTTKPPTLIGWRLLALAYDFFPVFGLWFAVAAMFVAAHHDAVLGGTLGLFEFIAMWLVTGAYAAVSWRYGGRTLGMRPWHLRVIAADGMPTKISMLLGRYAVGTVSLLLVGAGFWWAWLDRDRLTLHDRISGTRMVRDPAPAKQS